MTLLQVATPTTRIGISILCTYGNEVMRNLTNGQMLSPHQHAKSNNSNYMHVNEIVIEVAS